MESDVRHPVLLVICLPNSKQAVLCEGRQPGDRPIYAVDGVLTAIDVSIPPDLAATGWCWFGSPLYQPYPGREDGPGVGIATCTFAPPGWPSPYKTCFESAYEIERIHAEHEALRDQAGQEAQAPRIRAAAGPRRGRTRAGVGPGDAGVVSDGTDATTRFASYRCVMCWGLRCAHTTWPPLRCPASLPGSRAAPEAR